MTYLTGEVKIPNFTTECGFHFDEVTLAYERCGPKGAPFILVCHALTGNQFTVGTDNKPGWWRGLIHDGGYVDTNKYQIITFNVLGGCDGSTGPSSKAIDGEKYDDRFPKLTVRDLVEIQYIALRILGIDELKAVIGGSLGGMQVLEWGLMYPDFMEAIFPIAVTHEFSDYAIAFNHISKLAIELDKQKGNVDLKQGLSLARMIGMITYRSDDLFTERFNREKQGDVFEIESYLNYQGKKLASRFNPRSYVTLLDVMNSHDISRDRGSLDETIKLFQVPIFSLGYKKDLLYPPHIIKNFVAKVNEHGGYAEFFEIDTKFGHDGFLVEFEKWGHIIQEKLASLEKIEA